MVQEIYPKMYPISFSNTYHDVTDLVKHGMVIMIMVAAPPPPPNYRGDLKIPDQNNWGDLSKKSNLRGGGELNLRGGLKF